MVLTLKSYAPPQTLEVLKEDILYQAIESKEIPSELRDSLDHLFEQLDVDKIGPSKKTSLSGESAFVQRYGLSNYDVTVLHASPFFSGSGAYLLVGPPSVDWDSKSNIYHIFAGSNPIKAKNDWEVSVLHGLVKKIGADSSAATLVHDRERSREDYGRERRIRYDIPLTKEALLDHKKIATRLLTVGPTYQAYVRFQQQEDRKIQRAVDDILNSIK